MTTTVKAHLEAEWNKLTDTISKIDNILANELHNEVRIYWAAQHDILSTIKIDLEKLLDWKQVST